MAKLRNCSATVEHHDITVQIAATGELVNVPNAYILKSYSSYVAVYRRYAVSSAALRLLNDHVAAHAQVPSRLRARTEQARRLYAQYGKS